MRQLNILITGGAGFIGSHLTDKLLSLNCNVIVLDNLRNGREANLSEAFKNPNFEFIEGDILDIKMCESATANVDIVYHLACLGVRHSLHSPFENHRVNAEGTLNMLEASRKNKVKRFFYISTSEIYGDIKTFPIDESGIPLPKTVYGSSKLAGENYAYSYYKCFGLDTTILRIFNNYGPRAHYEGDAGEIIPRSIVNALYGKSPIIFGDGNVTRDFFYVKDTAKALAKLIDISTISGEIINIGTGQEITMKHLLEQVIELMNSKLKIEYHEDRPADVPRLWVNPSKFKKITNFSSSYTFEQGLIETITYYKELMKTKNLVNEIALKNWEK
ncbi:MAG: 3-beta hydroxysteroid dehydrogenase [Bacteroidetes bacterium RIFCSPLOWO2_12_FULL_35_15]|nr:MAG: 3-beta hydroxysteroid dehydrogenase [Bacteroidetes bacterium RIFCSPLOWO2_12_FULL_35_15]